VYLVLRNRLGFAFELLLRDGFLRNLLILLIIGTEELVECFRISVGSFHMLHDPGRIQTEISLHFLLVG
jgi:hypothetical protein